MDACVHACMRACVHAAVPALTLHCQLHHVALRHRVNATVCFCVPLSGVVYVVGFVPVLHRTATCCMCRVLCKSEASVCIICRI